MYNALLPSVISVIAFLILFVYLPGRIIAEKFKLKDWWDFHLMIGVIILMIYLFFSRFIISSNFALIIYLILVVIVAYKNKIKLRPKIIIPDLTISLSLLFGVIIMAWSFIVTATHGSLAILYESFRSRDQSWHIALIAEISQRFPPQIPGFSGVVLKNYHYFMDLFMAANYAIFGGEIAYFMQIIYPILFAVFLGVSIYRIMTLITAKKLIIAFTIIFFFISNNFSYLLHFLGTNNWQSDSFFLDQPLIYLGNLQTVFSLALFIYLIIMLGYSLKYPQKKMYPVLIGILISALIKVKIYAFVIGGLLMGVWVLWQLVLIIKKPNKQRINNIIIASFITVIVSGFIYILSFQSGKEFLVWEPGWILQVFYERVLYQYWIWFKHHYMVYKIAGSPKYYFLLILVISLYLIVNLGLRLIGLFALKLQEHRNYVILLFLSSIFVILILLLFRQSAGGYNIIQFGPYAVCALSILTGIYLSQIKVSHIWLLFISVLIILISSPVTIKTIYGYQQADYRHFNYDLVNALRKLREYPYGVVVNFGLPMAINKNEADGGQHLIGAIAYKPSFLTDKTQIEVLDFSWRERAVIIKRWEENWCNFDQIDIDNLKKNHIKYFLVPSDKDCGGNPGLKMQKIIEEKEYTVLKLNFQ